MLITLTLGISVSAIAQGQTNAKVAGARSTAVSIPFVGCNSDGQAGPLEAPKGKSRTVPVGKEPSQKLAYYEAAVSLAVLAPRGWYCFGVYGSGGEALYVSPDPTTATHVLSTEWQGLSGPAVRLARSYGDTSGRVEVARVIARVFPNYRTFVQNVSEMFDAPKDWFPLGPYPADTLTYKSKRVVEYRTAAAAEGLGTNSQMLKNDQPIDGTAILTGRSPDLLLLSVRLPTDLRGLAPTIIHQAERDEANRWRQ